jgi:hypothetical protein
MPQYLLLKHYRGGPENHPDFSLFDKWAEGEFDAHMAFLKQVGDLLTERGELIEVRALGQEGTYVRYSGAEAAPVTTDGPFPETKELAAGYYVVDVESEARAHEIAALLSSAPGAGGKPTREWIEVRPVMWSRSDAVE